MKDVTLSAAVSVFNTEALRELYSRHFGDTSSPEEILLEMLSIICTGHRADIPEQTLNYLALANFFNDLFKPIRHTFEPEQSAQEN